MKNAKIKLIVLLFGMLLPTARGNYQSSNLQDGLGNIVIKEANVHSDPKSSSIQATINGHSLTVVFLENLGTVHIEVTDTNGGAVALTDLYTPNGYNAYIYNTGSYIVTFTLTNGDEYYGEFEVTN